MSRRFQITARVFDADDLLEFRTIALSGRFAQTLKALVEAGDKGVTALDVSSWALRMSHYIDKLRKDPRWRLHIETIMEPHSIYGMGPGQHARYRLRTRVELVSVDWEAA